MYVAYLTGDNPELDNVLQPIWLATTLNLIMYVAYLTGDDPETDNVCSLFDS